MTLVKTEQDQSVDIEEQGKKYNQWINISGWKVETCRVRVELSDGNQDPWNMNMFFGMRQVVIFGIEKEKVTNVALPRGLELIETVQSGSQTLQEFAQEFSKVFNELGFFGGATTESLFTGIRIEDVKNIVRKFARKNVASNEEGSNAQELLCCPGGVAWAGNCPDSWLEFDLGNLCMIDSIEIDWEDGREAEIVRVAIKTASGVNHFEILESLNQIGRKLRLSFSGENVAVQSVKIIGVEYTNKMIFERRIKRLLKNHAFIAGKLIEKIFR
jgi:hypothetical protein